jgi:hypothetical protein
VWRRRSIAWIQMPTDRSAHSRKQVL